VPSAATVTDPQTAPRPDAREKGDEVEKGNGEETEHGRHPDEDEHLRVAAQVTEPLAQAEKEAGVTAGLLLRVADAHEREEYREKTESIEEEVAGHAEDGHGVSAECGAENAGEVELSGVEGDGVG
jgi:hypothetical protein